MLLNIPNAILTDSVLQRIANIDKFAVLWSSITRRTGSDSALPIDIA